MRIKILFILLFPFVLQGQDLSTYFDSTTLQNYTIKHYTNANGLKQNIVYKLAVDESDFLWLGTPSGMIRFDGSRFTYFNAGKGYDSRVFNIKPLALRAKQYIVNFRSGAFGKISNGEFEIIDSIKL